MATLADSLYSLAEVDASTSSTARPVQARRGSASAWRVEAGFDSAGRRRQVWEWLGAGLRPGRPGRLQQEYPLLFTRDASSLHLTLYRGEDPVAFCALWPVHFRVGVRKLQVGLISLVFTDPDHRGKGDASRVVEAAIAHARRLGLGLVMLWSELDRFYSRLGFHRLGCESLVRVDGVHVDRALETIRAEASPLCVERPREDDWPAIERLRGTRTCQLELDPGALAKLREVPDLSVRVARDAAGVCGFAMRGRGDDLGEIIHEWGGDPRAVLLCCRALMRGCPPHEELMMLSPDARSEPAWTLRRMGAPVVRQSLAWMRIASPPALASDLASLLPDSPAIELEERPSPSPAGPTLWLRGRSGGVQVEPATLLTALFGSARGVDPRDCASSLVPALDARTLDSLPLPFFVWGLESI